MGEIHHHTHNHGGEISQSDELIALLNYMVAHNASHTEELSELAKQLGSNDKEEAHSLVLEAIEKYKSGNELLERALNLLK